MRRNTRGENICGADHLSDCEQRTADTDVSMENGEMAVVEIGQTVKYRLSQMDIDYVAAKTLSQHQNQKGQIVPMLIVRVWEREYGDQPGVNGRVFLDGEAILWVTSVKEIEPGIWGYPCGA